MNKEAKKTILVVDDEREFLDFISRTLERAGYAVLTAATGRQGLRFAKSLEPDLIVLDILLPDIEGGAIASQLYEHKPTAKIPILFLTGIITKKGEDFLRRHTGKCDVVAKPVTPQQLLDKIESLLH